MNLFEFTPGPWQSETFGHTGKVFSVDTKQGAIAHVYAKGEMVFHNGNLLGFANRTAFAANMRLIAAAPALAHALATLVQRIEDPDFTSEDFRDNAARGASNSALLQAREALALLHEPLARKAA
jgi:hypothetical protein